MRYRVFGQDAITKDPRPPLDIEAGSEATARARAAEMGMEVAQVEALVGTPVPIVPGAAS